MATEAAKRAQRRYRSKCKQYAFCFRTDGDADVIEALESAPSKVDYIRQLVRRDLRRGAQ